MNRKLTVFIIVILLMGVFMVQGTLASGNAAADLSKIEAGLYETIADAGEGDYIVYMKAEADLQMAYTIEDWAERGRFVVSALQTTATTSQADVLGLLDSYAEAGSVSKYESFWIMNVVLVTSDANALTAISNHPDVASITADQIAHIPTPISAPQAIEWGVLRINADDVWANYGATGNGIVVANIDTGVDINHPALQDQYRGWNGASYDHDHNFYDPSNICGGNPCDNNDHGTHTMGTMVGDDGGANQIGVAPDAEWIAAKGCEFSSCSSSALLNSAQWIVAPCDFGQNPGHASCDAAERPHIVNNSWGGGGGNPWYQASVDAWRAAGIVSIFSAGNSGPGAGTIGSPSDYCNAMSIGATTNTDAIAGFSSRGPGAFGACTDKPDMSAPGQSIRSAVDGGGYASFSGTSMAAPHVSGCAALLLDIDPTLDHDDIYNLLTTTAVDFGSSGFDFSFGHGRIDCLAAADAIGGGGGQLTLTVTPIGSTTIPTCGGQLTFDVSISNTTGSSQTVDVWSLITLPNSNTRNGFGPRTVTVPDGTTFTRTRTQNVPARAGGGAYSYDVMMGTFPGTVLETDGFGFTKAAGSCLTGSVDNWNVYDTVTGELLSDAPTSVALSESGTTTMAMPLLLIGLLVLAGGTATVMAQRRR